LLSHPTNNKIKILKMMSKITTLTVALLVTCNLILANNMLVQNVTTLGNDAVNKTIQVQFDISWDNSWRDSINYDAAWIFMKFKDANGLWQHVKLNPSGFVNGTGTANTLQVTSDKIGSWLYRSTLGSGTFNTIGMQLQWNYGLSGLTNVTGLEVRVFAVEMVYVPEGDFNCAKVFHNTSAFNSARSFSASGNNFPVINSRLSPTLTYNNGTIVTLRIKGDVGIDSDNNGTIDNTTYPIGYKHFYCYKYELTEQQYADLLNTLTTTQITTLGLASTGITLSNGQYFTSNPNKACGNSTEARLLAIADWSGLRPMSFLEFNKVSYGPLQPLLTQNNVCGYAILNGYAAHRSTCCFNDGWTSGNLVNVGSYATAVSTSIEASASFYGVLDLTGNTHEPVVKLNNLGFLNVNGDGALNSNGNHNVNNWINNQTDYVDMLQNYNTNCNGNLFTNFFIASKYGFRYVRSAE
jgi:hypothetical protein